MAGRSFVFIIFCVGKEGGIRVNIITAKQMDRFFENLQDSEKSFNTQLFESVTDTYQCIIHRWSG